MFTLKQFDTLHSMWNGLASNVEVCQGCGLCCNNTHKSLFPNEHKYLQKRSGVNNSYWASEGCLCNDIKIKSVICKIYPLQLDVHIDGKWSYRDEVGEGYTRRCSQLEYKNNKDMKKFFDFLFSDIHNRAFYMLRYGIDFAMKKVIAEGDKNEIYIEEPMLTMLSVAELFDIRESLKKHI